MGVRLFREPDAVADGVTCLMGVRLFREPDAVTPPVRFDEREQETEPGQTGLRRRRESFVSSHRETKATAPVLDSTRHSTQNPSVSVMGSRVENRRSGFSLPVAIGMLSHGPPQSGLA